MHSLKTACKTYVMVDTVTRRNGAMALRDWAKGI
jgi:hypothetical protein